MEINQELKETCGFCGYQFDNETCSVCELVSKTDDHLSDVFQNIVTQYYSSYMFEIEDNEQYFLRWAGLSFRQDIKKNIEIASAQRVINIKTFYLLAYSHIEAIFNEIQSFMELNKMPLKKDLINLFTEYSDSNRSSEEFNFKGRFFKAVEFTRLIANTIKHSSGIVNNVKSGKYLIKKYSFREGKSIFEHKKSIKGLKITATLEDVYEICCMMHVYFRDIISSLTNTNKYKYKSLNKVQITYDLVKLQIDRKIGRLIINKLGNQKILFGSMDLNYLSNKRIHDFLNAKIKIIKELYKKNPNDIWRFEIYGWTQYENDELSFIVDALNIITIEASNPKNKYEPISDKNKRQKVVMELLRNMSEKYSENIVVTMFLNQFHTLKNDTLYNYINDFYSEIDKLTKSKKIIVMKTFGAAPFRCWNPFMFGANKFNFL